MVNVKIHHSNKWTKNSEIVSQCFLALKGTVRPILVGHFFAWVDINTAINKNTVQL